MNANIFREYDIRGKVPEELNAETAHRLGLSIGTYYRQHHAQRISLGRDCRSSSPELHQALVGGLTETGLQVLDIGMIPTPLLYFSTLPHKNESTLNLRWMLLLHYLRKFEKGR